MADSQPIIRLTPCQGILVEHWRNTHSDWREFYEPNKLLSLPNRSDVIYFIFFIVQNRKMQSYQTWYQHSHRSKN